MIVTRIAAAAALLALCACGSDPGERALSDATRDVVVQLSQRALALARSASNPPPRTKSVDGESESDGPRARRHADRNGDSAETPTPRVNVRA